MTEITINSTETIESSNGRTVSRKYAMYNGTDLIAECNSLGVSLYWSTSMSLKDFLTQCEHTDLITGESGTVAHTEDSRLTGTFEEVSDSVDSGCGFITVAAENVEFTWEHSTLLGDEDNNEVCILVYNSDSIDRELEELTSGTYLPVTDGDTDAE